MKEFKYIFNISLILFFGSCTFTEDGETSADQMSDSIIYKSQMLSEGDKSRINNLINSIGPPLEFCYILNDFDLKFSSKVLSSSHDVKALENTSDMAKLMGMYGADLVYCLIYNRPDKAAEILNTIEVLAEKLNLRNVIDFGKMRDLAEKNTNPDDIAMEFTAQMELVLAELEKRNQLSISGLISYGGWIESLFIGVTLGEEITSNEELSVNLKDLVLYESELSNTFLEIFEQYKNMPGFAVSIEQLTRINSMFNDLQINVEKIKPQVSQTDNMTQVVNLSTQEIIHKPGHFDKFGKEIVEIRNNLVEIKE